ncbi:hypothetical protein EVAR_42602_1 [Eumeta japonica]|uniref:Uncharacterized protein n=1 Tax=Eumeta variegata TaxID=151549 RepID=A0A4C1XNT8_EUMVA|nr:hypothetical protein EVAR_42602_1 [Eumeta japonica]
MSGIGIESGMERRIENGARIRIESETGTEIENGTRVENENQKIATVGMAGIIIKSDLHINSERKTSENAADKRVNNANGTLVLDEVEIQKAHAPPAAQILYKLNAFHSFS